MRTKLVESGKPEKYIHSVRNSEASASIPQGTPLVLNLSGTPQPTTYQNGLPAGVEDGLQVVLPSTAGAWSSLFLDYGVALNTIGNQQLGESIVHGVCTNALVVVHTRAASTDSWSAVATQAASLLLSIGTVNNAFETVASTLGYTFSETGGATSSGSGNFSLPNSPSFVAILLDSITTLAGSASATSDTRTAITMLKRVFLRRM